MPFLVALRRSARSHGQHSHKHMGRGEVAGACRREAAQRAVEFLIGPVVARPLAKGTALT
jgi:hypothetical protein